MVEQGRLSVESTRSILIGPVGQPPVDSIDVISYEKVNSNTSLKLDTGMNSNKFTTGYLSIGVSGLYRQTYTPSNSAGVDSFDAFPLLGFGLEYRISKHFGAKLDYITTFITKCTEASIR